MDVTRGGGFNTSSNDDEMLNTMVSELMELRIQDGKKTKRIDEMAARHARMIREEAVKNYIWEG